MTPTAIAQNCTVQDVAWMEGDWRHTSARSLTQESWTMLADGTMEARGQVVSRADGHVRGGEVLRLVVVEGRLTYLAKPDTAEDFTPFIAQECTDSLLVVTNPAHDFPRRLEYHRVSPDSIHVLVSDGGGQGFELWYGRRRD